MKTVILIFAILASSLRLQADDALKNGDFSDGVNHWIGDGQDVAHAAPDLTTKGMFIRLDPHRWTKAVQQFTPDEGDFTCSITYRPSPDLKFSGNENDYKNIPGKIGYTLFKPFKIQKGDWLLMLCDFGDSVTGSYFPIQSEVNADGTATFQTNFLGLNPRMDKTIALAFPPGQGSVVILNVSMTNTAQPVLADTSDFTLTGAGVTIQTLVNGGKAFANRKYVWQGIPDSLAGQRYTQVALKGRSDLTVHAKNNCTLQVIATANPTDWPKTGLQFSYSDKHNTQVYVYEMPVSAGHDFIIPRDPIFGDAIVILPN